MNASDAAVTLFACDTEETLLGEPVGTRKFRLEWEALPSERRPLLVFNTRRTVEDVRWIVLERRLPAPEFIIGSLGTEVFDPLDARTATEYHAYIAENWDRGAVEQIVERHPGVHRQPPEYLHTYKLSWHWPCATPADVARLELSLENAGLDITVSFTGGVHLDIFPRRAGKGNALAWLCRRIGVTLERVLVAGAPATNAPAYALPGIRGIVLGNSARETFAAAPAGRTFITPQKMGDGVLEGLMHYGVLAADAEHDLVKAMLVDDEVGRGR